MIGSIVSSSHGAENKKLTRAKLRAERKYNEFSYPKAVKFYKEVLELQPENQEAILKIADSYHKMNDGEEAVTWYRKALTYGEGNFSTDDKLNFAHSLSLVEEYDASKIWYEKGGKGDRAQWVDKKVSGLEHLDSFLKDSLAYDITKLNINTEQLDFSPAYYKDGIVFSSSRPSGGLFKPKYSWDKSLFLDLFYVEDPKRSRAEDAEKLPRNVNTRFHEGPAVFYANDTKSMFTRNNYHKGKSGQSSDAINKLQIFYTEKKPGKENKWCPAKPFPYNSDEYSVGHPTLSKDGKTLYFASDMPGTLGGADIWKSELVDNKWGTPQNLGSSVNTEEDELFPHIWEDRQLYFASKGHEGLGGLDIFVYDIKSQSRIKNIGYPINTNKDDFGLIINEAGNDGYLSSSRKGGKGADDIYSFVIYDYDINVNLVDSLTKESLTGEIWVYDDEGVLLDSVEKAPNVVYKGLRGHSYTFKGSKEKYDDNSMTVTTLDKSLEERSLSYDLPIYKAPFEPEMVSLLVVQNNGAYTQLYEGFRTASINELPDSTLFEEYKAALEKGEEKKLEEIYVVKNIYYDFDKYYIREDAAIDLNKVVEVLNVHQDLGIELSSHTDKRGSKVYNDKLARNRANAAARYLVDKGIKANRIKKSGFGEERLFDNCQSCTEDAHQSNRRTVIRLFDL